MTLRLEYDLDNRVSLDHYARRVLTLLGSSANEYSILDLGLRHGYTASIFDSAFKQHTIIDGNQYIIDKYNKDHFHHKSTIINAFFEDYESDKEYDVIIAGFILEHVENPIQTLKKYKEHLKSEGRFFIFVPNATSLNRQMGHEVCLMICMSCLTMTEILAIEDIMMWNPLRMIVRNRD